MLNFIFFKVKQKIDTYTNARTDSPTIGYAEKFGINLDIFFFMTEYPVHLNSRPVLSTARFSYNMQLLIGLSYNTFT